MRKTIAMMLLSIASLPVSASVVYTDATLFGSATAGATTEDFESSALSGSTGGGAVTSLMFSDFSVSTSPAAAKVLDTTFTFSQNTTPGGAKYLYLDTDLGGVGSISTFSFDSAVSSVGFFYTYNPTWDATSNLDVMIGADTFTLGPVSTDGVGFWGITDVASFSSFQIDSGTISGFGIDDMRYGGATSPVPEPASLALMGLGLVGIGFSRRKK